MKPFHTIAVPHKDILAGRLTMDVFAADLWEVHLGRAPDEYKDPDTFFKKTYLTVGLKNLLDVIEKKLTGKGGDPVIQIQTPFGGGKTHALIAMYHKAKQWKAKTVVLSGTAMSGHDTMWGLIEKQLTGSVKKMAGDVSPGKEVLREVLSKHQPILILMDEILEYSTKAMGVGVKDTTLAAQTLAFMQEISEVAGTLDKVCLVITLPSSILEFYDEKSEKMLQQLQKVSGRVEKIYTPVQENEITNVIRQRLFSEIKESAAKDVIKSFVEYAEKERILPVGTEPSVYRHRFINSYPFMPEVVDILYHRWGSLPTFQRTRGVLRLLSLVIHSLRESGSPFISLSDFDLSQQELRRELTKHIGSEFDSVMAADITDTNSGAKKVDKSLGNSYQGLRLGTKAATAIFLYSFSGGHEKGATIGEIKRAATTMENPSSVVVEAVEQLNGKLFFLQSQNEKYYFANRPNLNRIVMTKMENIKDSELKEREKILLKQQISGARLKVIPWPEKPKDVPDSEDLKLVILQENEKALMKNVIETKGDSPRVYRNTVLFLVPSEAEKTSFVYNMKKRIAYEQIESDKTLSLTESQRKDITNTLKKDEDSVGDVVRRFYRLIYLPSKDGLKEIDLGIPTFGERKKIDDEVYDKLRSDGEILERIDPLVVKEKYLRDKDYVKVVQIHDSMLKTPGESRPMTPNVIQESLGMGVRQGFFGLGEISDGKVTCHFFKEEASISLTENEVIVNEVLCKTQKQLESEVVAPQTETQTTFTSTEEVNEETDEKIMKEVTLRFPVPRGKISQIMGVMNFLQSKFQSLDLEIRAKEGNMSEEDFNNKIKEALKQLGIRLD